MNGIATRCFKPLRATAVAKAAPDGYTLLLAVNNVTINPYIYKTMEVDVARELRGIGVAEPKRVGALKELPAIGEVVKWGKVVKSAGIQPE